MSVEALAIGLHHSRAKGAAKLVLIGIANHDGDGGAWPSIATLAKYAGVTPRNVQKAISELERLGEIQRMVAAGGNHLTAEHMRPNLYYFKLTCPPDCDRSRNHRTRRDSIALEIEGVSLATGGVAGDGGGVSLATGGGVSLATPEPSSEPQIAQLPRPTTDAREAGARFERIVRAKCQGTKTGVHKFAADGYCLLCAKHSSTIQTVDLATGEIA